MAQDTPQPTPVQAGETNIDTMLGKVVVDQGLATSDEVDGCIALQKELAADEQPRPLSDILIDNGFITQSQLKRAMADVDVERGKQQIPGYQLLDKLGAGAMATVFKARQLSLDRVVALKVLPKKYMTDAQFVERFYEEGRVAAKLNHPNIVQAFDVGQAGDYHYFVMEYVEGHTVYDHLVKNGAYSEADALTIVIAIAEALEHAQTKGLMHRDVKPKNIMITKGGVAKLADMGLARSVSDKDAAEAEAGKAYGTPYYIAPEQIRGEVDIDGRADIYGLGATLYHMVTGRVPFDGPNPSAVMHKHLKHPLEPPDHVNENLSAGVGEIIEVMMAKDRAERYDTATDLLADLRAVAAGEPPSQARKKFDLTKLADLESSGEQQEPAAADQVSLFEQPLFWVAAGSILANIVLVIILILGASG